MRRKDGAFLHEVEHGGAGGEGQDQENFRYKKAVVAGEKAGKPGNYR